MLRRFILTLSLLLFGITPSLATQTTLTTPGPPLPMTGLATFLNNAFLTLGGCFSGSSAPAAAPAPITYQCWMDTTANPRILKIYDGANWVSIATLNTSTHAYGATLTALSSVNLNAAALPTPTTGTVLQIGNADAAVTGLQLDAFGTSKYDFISFRAARGTAASPTAPQAGDLLGAITSTARGATAYGAGSAQLRFVALENQTDTAQGQFFSLWTTLPTTTAPVETVQIGNYLGTAPQAWTDLGFGSFGATSASGWYNAPRNAALYAISANSNGALVGQTSTKVQTGSTAQSGIAIIGMAAANHATFNIPAFASYFECGRVAANGFCYGTEIDIFNTQAVTKLPVYGFTSSFTTKPTIGVHIVSGTSASGLTLTSPSAALDIQASAAGNSFDRGIVFLDSSLLDQGGGVFDAINLANGYRINYFRNNSGADQLQAFIGGYNDTVGTAVQSIVFGTSNTMTLTAGTVKVAGGATVLSGASGTFGILAIGRTAAEFNLGVAASANQFFTGTAAGDAAVQSAANLFLIAGGGSGKAIILTTAGGTTLPGALVVSGTITGASIDAGQLTGTIVAGRMPALTGDITTSAGAVATTLATVNSNVGTFGSATQSVQFTVNGKGLITAAANVTVTPAIGSVTGLAANCATWLATSSSANLAACVTDETGTGALVFGTSPTFTTSIIAPLHIGGSATSATLTLQSTSGAGATDSMIFQTGAQVTRATIATGGKWSLGPRAPNTAFLDINQNAANTNTGIDTAQMVRIVNADGNDAVFEMNAFGAAASNKITGAMAGGTLASPSATASGKNLFNLVGYGYGTSYALGAAIQMQTAELWSGSARGTSIFFFTTPATTTSIAEVMRLQAGVSIGTSTDPGAGGLQVNAKIYAPNLTSTTGALSGAVCTVVTTGEFQKDTNAGGCLVSFRASKNVLASLDPASSLDIVMRLDPIDYRYKPGYGDGGRYEQVGFIAEDVAAIDPRLAAVGPDGQPNGVRYMQITAVLTGAIQRLKADNDNLRAANDNLAARLAKLEAVRQ